MDIRPLYLCDFLKNRFLCKHSTFVLQTIIQLFQVIQLQINISNKRHLQFTYRCYVHGDLRRMHLCIGQWS